MSAEIWVYDPEDGLPAIVLGKSQKYAIDYCKAHRLPRKGLRKAPARRYRQARDRAFGPQ